MKSLSSTDCIIIVVYLAVSLLAGIYGRKYVSGISGFIVAGRELGTFIGIATLAATEIGTVTFMYYAELGYKTGFSSFINGLIAGGVMIYWKGANTFGAYCATLLRILGAVFFFFHVSTGYAGLLAFVLSGFGMVAGSLLARKRASTPS